MRNRILSISKYILIILISISLFQICYTEPSFGQKSGQQSTSGPNSPIINNSKDLTINIGVAEESIEALKEYINSQNKETQELKKRLTEIHKKEFDSTPKEAEAWAAQFISSLPIRKDKFVSLENDKKDYSEKAKIQIPILFDYIFRDFDARILALKKYKSGVNLIVNTDFKLLVDSKSPDFKQYTPREVTFPNGNILKLFLIPGTFSNSLIRTYPNIRFCEVKNNNIVLLNIGETTTFGNVTLFNRGDPVAYTLRYRLDGDPINEQFKTGFSNYFDKVMQTMFLGIRETY